MFLDNPLETMFSAIGVTYGLVAPLVFIVIFLFFLTASLTQPGAKARSVAQATYCYLLMGVGLLMMTISSLPTVASVFAGVSYTGQTYFGLLLLFVVGGCIFLWHDNWVHTIDHPSQLVPSLVYLFTVKCIGVLALLLSGLSIGLTLIFGGDTGTWWATPLAVFLYGFLLTWCTRSEKSPSPLFQSVNMNSGIKPHAPPRSKKKLKFAWAKKK
jgi:hypothetical protein